jgi:hypothetical protein
VNDPRDDLDPALAFLGIGAIVLVAYCVLANVAGWLGATSGQLVVLVGVIIGVFLIMGTLILGPYEDEEADDGGDE